MAFLLLLFLWLLWMRSTLNEVLRLVQQGRGVLEKDLQMRRDTVPFLLESFRGEPLYESVWHQLLDLRKKGSEAEFEAVLLPFLEKAQIKSLNFLEAKKDILDLTRLIHSEEQSTRRQIGSYMALKKSFPFSMAAVLFGLPEFS